MAKPRVFITRDFHPERIRAKLLPHATITRSLREADGLIAQLTDPIDRRFLARAPRLKVVGNFAVGVNNIDLKECRRRGIRVVNTPKVLTRATAELAAALLLACARRIPEGHDLCRRGRFKGWSHDLLLGLELKGRRAVIVGQGRIGSETSKIFRALGLKTEFIAHRDSQKAIAAKLARAQILSLHLPLTKQTHHWLNAKRLALLPRDSIVINTSRGPVIDEAALIRALKTRRIFAAGLDVFEREPRIPPALRKLPNVTLAPHIGSATSETRAEMADLVIDGVLRILNGKRAANEVK